MSEMCRFVVSQSPFPPSFALAFKSLVKFCSNPSRACAFQIPCSGSSTEITTFEWLRSSEEAKTSVRERRMNLFLPDEERVVGVIALQGLLPRHVLRRTDGAFSRRFPARGARLGNNSETLLKGTMRLVFSAAAIKAISQGGCVHLLLCDNSSYELIALWCVPLNASGFTSETFCYDSLTVSRAASNTQVYAVHAWDQAASPRNFTPIISSSYRRHQPYMVHNIVAHTSIGMALAHIALHHRQTYVKFTRPIFLMTEFYPVSCL